MGVRAMKPNKSWSLYSDSTFWANSGGQRIGQNIWVGSPGKVPAGVILSKWHGKSKAKLLPPQTEYKLLRKL